MYLTCFSKLLSHYEESLVGWPLPLTYDVRQKDSMNKFWIFVWSISSAFFTQAPFLNLQVSSACFKLSVFTSHPVNFNRYKPIIFFSKIKIFLSLKLWCSCKCQSNHYFSIPSDMNGYRYWFHIIIFLFLSTIIWKCLKSVPSSAFRLSFLFRCLQAHTEVLQ